MKKRNPSNKGAKTKSQANENGSRLSFSRLKFYAFPVIVSIALWYFLNQQIFNQVKHTAKVKKTSGDKFVADGETPMMHLNEDGALSNYQQTLNNAPIELEHKQEISDIETLITSGDYKKATVRLNELGKLVASSPYLVYLSAVLFDKMSEAEQSNTKLKQAIKFYAKMFEFVDVDVNLLYVAGLRLLNRLEFIGNFNDAIKYNQQLLGTFKNNINLLNQLGVTYLIMNKSKQAKEQFLKVLNINENNSVAQCHLAFVLKQHENKLNESVGYFKNCLSSGDKRVMDGRFFYHLGDALQRLDKKHEAYEFYEIAVENGIFLSVDQRSLYNEKNLAAKPWWSMEESSYFQQLKILEDNWMTVKKEAMDQLASNRNSFVSEDEGLREKGDWKEFILYLRGKKVDKNCARVPFTCKLIDKIEAASTCKRGQVKFSLLTPGVHIWPHCGPTNCRLRAHLGLKIPSDVYIRVANETRPWLEGKFIIFDDSFEHEVWHNGTEPRLVLIVDLWHPDLDKSQRLKLTPI